MAQCFARTSLKLSFLYIKEMFYIRPAQFPADYPGIAQMRNAEAPDWPVTAEELAREDDLRDQNDPRIVLVAEASQESASHIPGSLAGVATAGQDPMAHREGRFKIDLRVPPDLQGRGIGKALYQDLMDRLAPLRPDKLVTEVWAALERPNRFVIERGFVEAWRRLDSTLDVTGFDFTPYAWLEECVRALGFEVKTYGELQGDPRRLEKLWELDCDLWQDVPYGEPVTRPSLERFEKEVVLSPDFLPQACFVAVCGEAFAGYSLLLQGKGYYDTDMTGVRREYRGRGLAILLKIYGIRYALEHGGFELRTVNDSVNLPILAINEKLGFKRQGANIRYVKKI